MRIREFNNIDDLAAKVKNYGKDNVEKVELKPNLSASATTQSLGHEIVITKNLNVHESRLFKIYYVAKSKLSGIKSSYYNGLSNLSDNFQTVRQGLDILGVDANANKQEAAVSLEQAKSDLESAKEKKKHVKIVYTGGEGAPGYMRERMEVCTQELRYHSPTIPASEKLSACLILSEIARIKDNTQEQERWLNRGAELQDHLNSEFEGKAWPEKTRSDLVEIWGKLANRLERANPPNPRGAYIDSRYHALKDLYQKK